MVLKDWKKTNKLKRRIEWHSKIEPKGLYLFYRDKEWFVRKYKNNLKHFNIGKFKNKTSAIKVAKSYMRTH